MKKKKLALAASLTITVIIGFVCGSMEEKKYSPINTKKWASVKEQNTNKIVSVEFKGKGSDRNKQSTGVNKKIFSCEVNKDKTPGFIPANEGEQVTADAFFVSNKYIFLDDTVGKRVLVYSRYGSFVKEIKLEWNQNIKRMSYSEKQDILSVVYEDTMQSKANYYHIMKIKVETGDCISDKEISNEKNILLDYYFNADGTLETTYVTQDELEMAEEKSTSDEIKVDIEENKEKKELSEDLDKLLETDCDYSICNTDADNNTATICSVEDASNGVIEECIVLSKDNKAKTYAVPEEHNDALLEGNIQTFGNKIYQMTIEENQITIYELVQNKARRHNISGYTRNNEIGENGKNGVCLLSTNCASEINVIKTAANTSPLSFETISNRAYALMNCNWSYKKKNRLKSVISSRNRRYVKQPSWLENLNSASNPNGQVFNVSNVPYCWGGYCTVNSFKNEIDDGYFAGNVNLSSDTHIDKTAGCDCSGFVSIVYKLGDKYGTSGLTDCGAFNKRVYKRNVAQGDILIYSGHHVVIVLNVYELNGQKFVKTIEQCASQEKIRVNYLLPYTYYSSNGYWPYKYVNYRG